MKIIKKLSRQLHGGECESDGACPAIFETDSGTICIIGEDIKIITEDGLQKVAIVKISKQLLGDIKLGDRNV